MYKLDSRGFPPLFLHLNLIDSIYLQTSFLSTTNNHLWRVTLHFVVKMGPSRTTKRKYGTLIDFSDDEVEYSRKKKVSQSEEDVIFASQLVVD